MEGTLTTFRFPGDGTVEVSRIGSDSTTYRLGDAEQQLAFIKETGFFKPYVLRVLFDLFDLESPPSALAAVEDRLAEVAGQGGLDSDNISTLVLQALANHEGSAWEFTA